MPSKFSSIFKHGCLVVGSFSTEGGFPNRHGLVNREMGGGPSNQDGYTARVIDGQKNKVYT